MVKIAFFIVWYFSPYIKIGSQHLTCYSHIIPWFWRCDFHIIQTIKLIRYVQDDVLLTALNIPMFTNIAPSTNFHFHWCKLQFPERLPSVATMINIWCWCYNFYKLRVLVTTITIKLNCELLILLFLFIHGFLFGYFSHCSFKNSILFLLF